MTQFIVRFSKNGAKVKENMLRLQRHAAGNEVCTVFLDMRFPKQPWDKITIFFWNGEGEKAIRIDDLRLEIFE